MTFTKVVSHRAAARRYDAVMDAGGTQDGWLRTRNAAAYRNDAQFSIKPTRLLDRFNEQYPVHARYRMRISVEQIAFEPDGFAGQTYGTIGKRMRLFDRPLPIVRFDQSGQSNEKISSR